MSILGWASTKANADASASTAQDNADASAETAQTNADNSATTAKTNADNSALTTKDNANRSALTAKTNADAIATTSKANADANANTAYGNQYRDIQANRNKFTMERQLALSHLNLLVSGEYMPGYSGFIGSAAWENRAKVGDDWDQDYLMQYAVTEIGNYGTSQAAVINGVGGAVSSVVGGAAAGLVAGPGGAGVGAVSGLVGSAVSLAQASASVPLQIGVTTEMRDVTLKAGENKTGNAMRYIANMYTLQSNLESNKYDADDTWLTNIANLIKTTGENDATDTKTTALNAAQRNYDTDTANNARTYTTATTNAGDSYNTDTTNNANTKNTAITNNQNTYDVTVANAQRTYDTATANNLRAYNTAIANAQRTYDAAIANNLRSFNNAKAIADRIKQTADDAIANDVKQAALQAPKEFGSFANGEHSTTRPQGVFCNIVTQSKDAIEQAGDYFLRYGYAVNRSWEFTTFNLMPKFTYWKCSDVWIKNNTVPDAYMDEIRFFLLGGVCVWRKPEDIGNISIYENV